MASQASTHSGARILAQGCWPRTLAPSSMKKMTQMLAVKVTQLQDEHLGSEDPPCLAGAASAWGCGCQQDPCPSAQGCCNLLGQRPSCRKHPNHSGAGPALGEVQLLACPRVRQCPGDSCNSHTPSSCTSPACEGFFSPAMLFKTKIFLYYQQHFILLFPHFQLPRDSSWPAFPAPLLSWASQITTSK